jgi:2-polyprenyl-3-methyl-5-hydroxy-6-metoxy-1,4-benzoquinol methylase
MQKAEYVAMFELENHHWWFKGLHELVEHYVQHLNYNNLHILDAGCGTGAMSEIMTKYGAVDGIDFSPDAIDFCEKRGLKNIVLHDLNDWQGKSGYYDIIVSLDVLYHQGIINDAKIIRRFYSSLKEGGILIINLPAFESLRRGHDVVVKSARRYTRKKVEDILRESGFSVHIITYRLPLLFIIIKLLKALQFFIKSSFLEKSDTRPLPAIINRFFLMMVRIENQVIRNNISIFFGSSVFAVAKKDA